MVGWHFNFATSVGSEGVENFRNGVMVGPASHAMILVLTSSLPLHKMVEPLRCKARVRWNMIDRIQLSQPLASLNI